jgi:hypothetical protein
MPAAATIDDVLLRLDGIVDRSRRERSRAGYFAALYRNVTAAVKTGIAGGRFEDGPRMQRLDVVFANRYLEAYDAWRTGRPMSRSWRLAFDASAQWPPLVLQHLLLGMNAHISLDLGVAAAEVAPGPSLATLGRDFAEINVLLGEMIDDVQGRITRISPLMGVLDRVGQRTDERVCGFCIDVARKHAWGAAERLAPLTGSARQEEIAKLDLLACALALPVRSPGPVARAAMLGIRFGEVQDVGRVIDALDARLPS